MICTRSLALLLSLLLVATAANSAPLPTSNCPSCPALSQPSSLEARAGGEEGVSGAKELLDDGHVAYLLKLSEASGYSNQAAHYESLGEKLTDGGRTYAEGLRKMAHEKKVEAWRAEAARLRNLGSALTDAGRKLAEKLEKQVDEADQQAKD